MAPSRAPFVCASCARSLRAQRLGPPTANRAFSATTIQHEKLSSDQPRWKQTPPAMRMAFRLRPVPKQPVWKVNDDPELLDEMYDAFVGRVGDAAKGQEGLQSTSGRDLLPEEIKWLAVTHKSFEHGAQGYNDRLAFLGKRIIDLQTSLALLNSPASPATATPADDRNIFRHAALENVDNMTAYGRAQVLAPSRLAKVAQGYGLDRVVRWKPRKSDNLQASGIDVVLAHAVYSIIGALALQRGGEVASRTARERVLQPLGLR
ncbi:hypothetical protein BAUCODRAFT_74525 [Baudoinia panamericana UAMH 10762]|uniref:RNase III domain-containing protein n=1 Tax=Baudoinia panamericana (strain UAMH 10762) TaxID=717646 RepID=M2N617_BAUPA|nr:uncharacterized protein BAUCODRAFT_74525 [Baudoinia panamericana UAMH 10762]EMC94225.1 hypothetical protein BAUCODRAFT_74525 [Baudoinia panamericana UAMH 10762]